MVGCEYVNHSHALPFRYRICLDAPSDSQRPTEKDGTDRGQQRMALLAHRRHRAANPTENRCARRPTETAGNLLLHFRHRQVLFRLIVGERHRPVFDKRQDLLGSVQ